MTVDVGGQQLARLCVTAKLEVPNVTSAFLWQTLIIDWAICKSLCLSFFKWPVRCCQYRYYRPAEFALIEQCGQLQGFLMSLNEQSDYQVDDLDAALLQELLADARVGVLELSRRLDVARGTVQARLQRLLSLGVVKGFKPDLSLDWLGYKVKAYVTVEVTQGQIESVVEPLANISEVLEVHSVAAQGDLMCLVAARSNHHMMDVLEKILAIRDVARTSTAIVLKTQIENRSHQLLDELRK